MNRRTFIAGLLAATAAPALPKPTYASGGYIPAGPGVYLVGDMPFGCVDVIGPYSSGIHPAFATKFKRRAFIHHVEYIGDVVSGRLHKDG